MGRHKFGDVLARKWPYTMVRSRDHVSKRQWLLSWTLHNPQSLMELEVKIDVGGIGTTGPAAFVDPREEAIAAFRVLKHVMSPVYTMHNADF